MKLSKRGEYALRALISLGLAHRSGQELLQLNALCERENIPKGFLEQIFLQLREASYIQAKRGKYGGYYLAKTPETISMGAIVRLVDGPLAPLGCVSQTQYEKCSCPDEATCGLRMLMLDVRNAVANILDRYTLGHVLDVATQHQKNQRGSTSVKGSSTSKAKTTSEVLRNFIPFSDFQI
ncbi:MAG: Rrf2 family transcriptional regulator [Blastochloris sp.]|nr:Rrf2 family transcriptional regulator [Blastochloris sp.]